MKRWQAVGFVIAITALMAACGGSAPPEKSAPTAAPVPVRAIKVERLTMPSIYEAQGTVQARTQAAISAKVMGYVQEVRVQTGDRVAQGQLLITLDSRDLDAALRQAEAAKLEAQSALVEAENGIAAAKSTLDLAEVTLKRMQDLFEKRSISNQEFDEANARYRQALAAHQMAQGRLKQVQAKVAQAEAALAQATVMQSYARITAPFAGVVTEKRVDPGALATPGQPLLMLERAGAYRLEVPVQESQLPYIKPGKSVEVVFDALGKTVAARVGEIVPAVDAATRTFTVKLDLPSVAELRSGLFGRARFPLGETEVLAVPEQAVRTRGQLHSVMVVAEGMAQSRLVTLGRRWDGKVEVLSGLEAGDTIVAAPPAALADGAKVEVR